MKKDNRKIWGKNCLKRGGFIKNPNIYAYANWINAIIYPRYELKDFRPDI